MDRSAGKGSIDGSNGRKRWSRSQSLMDGSRSSKVLDISKSLAVGIFSATAGADEICVYKSHIDDSAKNIASFGVFDGHDGDFAAKLCSKELHTTVIQNFNHLNKVIDLLEDSPYFSQEVISKQERLDTLLCESLRRASAQVNEFARKADSKSGTTAISLFLHQHDDKTIRATCSNLGDSRCVLYGSTFASIKYLPFAQPNSHREGSPGFVLKSYNMSEDHKLSLLRERSRVLGKLSLNGDRSWMMRPTTVFVSQPASIVAVQAAVSPTFELGYPPKDRIATADALLDLLQPHSRLEFAPRSVEFVTSRQDSSDDTNANPGENTEDREVDERISATRRTTFVDSENILVITKGVKIRTTRSIGDRHGPKGLVAVPEICAVTLNANEGGRFIIASRALWELVPPDLILQLVRAVSNPTQLAEALGRETTARLKKSQMCIHVIVVDPNPRFVQRDVMGIAQVEGGCACALS